MTGPITYEKFQRITDPTQARDRLAPLQLALWHDGCGDWNAAHDIVDDKSSVDACWIHAYLHRKEGDLANANYWYSRAGKIMPSSSLEDEWKNLVNHLLD